MLPTKHWIASPNFNPGRGGIVPDLLVVHDTEGGYMGSVSWFHNPASQVSIHYVLREDGMECIQMVHDEDKAWHVRQYNRRAIGIEMAGFAKKGFSDAEWGATAEMVVWLCRKHSIPIRPAAKRSDGLLANGICSHYQLGQLGGGHSDPTTDAATWSHFIGRVEAISPHDVPIDWPIAVAVGTHQSMEEGHVD